MTRNCLAFALALYLPSTCTPADDPPNVVWIVADDLGPELGCYGYPGVATPNIDRLAAEGVRYTRAFATAPVCSSSRTAFQTGRYQTTVGGHHHNTRNKPVLPESIPTVTGLMQEAGYFVSNGKGYPDSKFGKSHLNFAYTDRTFFDGVDWSERADGQRFFAQVQIKEPHRPFVKSERQRPNAPIPPNYPDHPVTRADWANYLASIEVLDHKVGDVLDRLDKEGIADNTLVIFFGDHGRPHVRGKQWLYEGGLHTPLIIRWPDRTGAGESNDGLTSLLDLMPTTLAAAGVTLSDSALSDLPGTDLLAPNWVGHQEIYAARDRCGDAPDRIRSVRTDRFKYIRNFHPEIPYLQLSSYKKLSYPVDTLMRVLHAKGQWDSPLMAAERPREELYDLDDDPWETNNLASEPAHAETLNTLRQKVDQWIVDTDDQGAVDESESVDIESLLLEKRTKYYERTMKKRGLDPDLPLEEYLDWWEKELGLK